ncbi:hypothetical protein OEW28_08505 [Defluviimonas sp. WL0002]|uniref:N,N-dimethylformamidase beta subunit-like C-terminal domain-containing protein n=1 Tax=Albidovulum marisflavi TaxID=2984159 RepID=A0ABT2ZC69_9RHOB|nr:N,N-dimethylformamidase beta subunit family domain-containing protein [Defluviimonas sp. WL0002]MCV2868667.1 hypothetical protein [Defluviimonas sp. WL0002]
MTIDPATEGPGPAITPRTRARARHILDHYYIGPARNAEVLEIWGYSDRMTYMPGDRVALHVSTTAETWDLEIGRDGVTYEPLYQIDGLPGRHHATPADCSVTGCGWPVEHSLTIPADWRPGGYLITFRARSGDDMVEEHHLILVRRASHLAAAPYLMVCATGTWVAYNCWGGSNAYEGIAGPEGNAYSPVLSLDRPWTRGFCKLPDGAPRALPDRPPRPGDMVRYPYMEWAYAYGYSKKFASAGWASYERHFARWAESEGYDVEMATLHDLHRDPSLIDRYRCLIFVGHDEYWSAEMRDAVDGYVDAGGRVARFAGNFLWQVRIEGEGRQQVCYKYAALDQDPLAGTSQAARVTGAWEAAPVSRPGCQTFGANALRGVYAGLGNCAGRGAGYSVYRPEHWAFAGTGLGYGDTLGTGSRVFGYEVDGLDLVFRDGLPFATGADGADPAIQVLAVGLAANVESDHGTWGETRYIGWDDAAFRAKVIDGADTPETRARAARGNGVMIHWKRGQGEVFNAATCEWVAGLLRRDPQVTRISKNVLDRFGAE